MTYRYRVAALVSLFGLAGCGTLGDKAAVVTDAADAAEEAGVVTVVNPGFESDWNGWEEVSSGEDKTAISEEGNSGAKSAKITGASGRFEQLIAVAPGSSYELTAHVKGAGVVGVIVDGKTLTNESEAGSDWTPISVPFDSEAASEVLIFGSYIENDVRFDDFEISPVGE